MRASTKAALVVLCLAIFSPGAASASVVSRLGAIYFYDPLSFDAGVLQRGGSLRQGLSTSGYTLDASVDLPMFHELALRLGYLTRLTADQEDGHDLTWRIRMPIFETARYGRLGSVQIVYAGQHPFAEPDPLAPRHEFSGAWSGSFARRGTGWTIHTQLGFLMRGPAEVEEPLTLGRFGLVMRLGFLNQIYKPPFGRGGMWSTTVSVAEITLVHFGFSAASAGAGRVSVVMGAPALHFSPRSATYTLGLVPMASRTYGVAGAGIEWGGLVVLSAFYRTHTE